jgi:pectin methylesterase-like acyl-CoA thioesterase
LVSGGNLKISNSGAGIIDIDFIAFYYDEYEDEYYVAGWFFYATSLQQETVCMFVYVDSDVTVTGGSNISVSLGRGWNRMYKVGNKLTTKAPDGLKWYYEDF